MNGKMLSGKPMFVALAVRKEQRRMQLEQNRHIGGGRGEFCMAPWTYTIVRAFWTSLAAAGIAGGSYVLFCTRGERPSTAPVERLPTSSRRCGARALRCKTRAVLSGAQATPSGAACSTRCICIRSPS